MKLRRILIVTEEVISRISGMVGSGKPGIAATVAGIMAELFPGSGIGASLDQADQLYAARLRQAVSETRPSGVPSRWHNPNTGNAGATVPPRTYRSAGGL